MSLTIRLAAARLCSEVGMANRPHVFP